MNSIPDHYHHEIQAREAIQDACPIDIYTASISPRWGWRWKLASYTEARDATQESCEMLMVDSSYTNQGHIDGVLEAARTHDADFITTTDHTPAVDGYAGVGPGDQVAERAADFFRVLADEWTGDVLLPIHPPVTDVVDRLQHYDPGHVLGYEDCEYFDAPQTQRERDAYRAGRAHYSYTLDLIEYAGGVAVGGLKDLPVARRIELLEAVHEATSSDVHVHALAPGTEPPMLRALRDQPELVDSLDVSTPERAVANNKLPDKTWVQRDHLLPTGEDSTTVRSAFAAGIAVQLAFMLTPSLCDDELFDEGASYQVALSEVPA